MVRSRKVEIGVETAKSNAPGAIDEEPVPCDADLAADRTLDVSRSLRRQRAALKHNRNGGYGGICQACSVDRAFNTQHQLVELNLGTDKQRGCSHSMLELDETIRAVVCIDNLPNTARDLARPAYSKAATNGSVTPWYDLGFWLCRFAAVG
jgi:hypothetical protein